MGSPDRILPLYYSSHLSNPLSVGSRGACLFDRHNSLSSGQQSRYLQPLQIEETMSRSHPYSVQPLVSSSLSWKGEAINYNKDQAEQQKFQLSRLQQSSYRPHQGTGGSNNTTADTNQFDAGTCSGSSIQEHHNGRGGG
jgi:hypothetical protein